MYFNKSAKLLSRSITLFKTDFRLFGISLLLVILGLGLPSIEFTRLHLQDQLQGTSTDFRIIYLIFQFVIWILSLVLGSVLFPLLIEIIKNRELEDRKVSLRGIIHKAMEKYEKVFVILFIYVNLLIILSGGGLFVTTISLISNIYYHTNLLTIYSLIGEIPLIATYITVEVLLSMVCNIIAIFVIEAACLEEGSFFDALHQGISFINRELPFIISCWIIINLLSLIPIGLVSAAIGGLYQLALLFPAYAPLYFISGLILYLLIYAPVIGVTYIFWTQVYLQSKNRVN